MAWRTVRSDGTIQFDGSEWEGPESHMEPLIGKRVECWYHNYWETVLNANPLGRCGDVGQIVRLRATSGRRHLPSDAED